MKDEVYNKLRKWIIIGELEPGTKLRDQDLSEQLGISRTPIREALLRLENDGLVVTKANRWTLVSPIDSNEAKSIYSIVWTLERLAMEQALPLISSNDIEELEQLNENFNEAIKTGEIFAILEADNKFHDKIIQLSNNVELLKLLSGLKVRIQRIEIHYFSQMDAKYTSYTEHQQIIDAIKKQDLNLAIDTIKANWKNSLDRIRLYTEHEK
ncbi:GntR family transcriptional regulator [Sporosarcina beigongshangi]|uniref:GntR family transcriptional regulator n=1 Tax=Sporosarcina beigongshangi TaxID=2782538 RepID=UPI001BAA082F|nr:GntR family transcriptional regulator [Sporosarcina beigongshangi]